MSTPLLKVNNLSIDFQTEDELVHAIQNISFELNESKTLALVGESGSGKSVSALSIIGLLPIPPAQIVSGSIEFCVNQQTSIDLLKCSPTTFETLRGNEIGMIFQEPMTSLNPLMKCGQQVAETILLHQKCSKDDADLKTLKLFEEVKLPTPKDMMNRYPHELSGGQKQRVMIAISICCNPSLLIADEPTTALDVTVQRTILELLKDLQHKRK
nr:ABC transporter ATP-binding protein [Saprospiraceae bacterium]